MKSMVASSRQNRSKLFAILLVVATVRPICAAASDTSQVFRDAQASVVLVLSSTSNGDIFGTGSGFVFKSDDRSTEIITANHVVDAAKRIEVVLDSNWKERYTATVVTRDAARDVAVLRIGVGQRRPLLLMDTCVALGTSKQSLRRWRFSLVRLRFGCGTKDGARNLLGS